MKMDLVNCDDWTHVNVVMSQKVTFLHKFHHIKAFFYIACTLSSTNLLYVYSKSVPYFTLK